MIKLVMADDEPVILKGLEKLVDWNSLGIDIVGRYTDGRSALEGIIALRPELALLDISMPGFSGLEVLASIKERNLPTEVVFISGFQDFEYVRSALLHGALDYILKPVVRSELMKSILRASCFTKNGQDADEKELEYDNSWMLSDSSKPFVLVLIRPLATSGDSLSRLRIFSIAEEIGTMVKSEDIGVTLEEKDEQFVLFKGLHRAEAVKFVRKKEEELFLRHHVHVVSIVSDELDSVVDVRNTVDKLISMAGYSYYASYFSRYQYLMPSSTEPDGSSSFAIMTWREKLHSALLSMNEEQFAECFSSFSAEIAMLPGFQRDEASFCYCNTLRLIMDKLKDARLEVDEPDLQDLMEKGRETQSFLELEKLCYRQYKVLFDSLAKSASHGREKEFMVALDYIEKHYAESIGLKNIADIVGMNTYYFSSYFKKNTGVNFKDYLRKVRMEHAMSLMISTDMLVGEVAAKVGYPDVRTFSEVFQKTFGEKPSLYIKRVRGRETELKD